MPRKIFIWVAHPKPGSLCAALADAAKIARWLGEAEILGRSAA